ncbi:MAG: DUF547 domain-containing protein [Planctomycetota bacterium]
MDGRKSMKSIPGVFAGFLTAGVLTVAVLAGCSAPASEFVAGHPLTGLVQQGIASGKGKFDHSEFDAILKKHVSSDSRVDYAALRADRKPLQAYLARMASAPLTTLNRDELMALLINAYNAYTLQLIATSEPVASIKDLKDPWDREFCDVGGQRVSLNFLEHKLLRVKELFGADPRVHFAVNCASNGCPPLARDAFTGAQLEKQLESATAACLKQPAYLVARDGKVYVSKILSWFGEDFTNRHGTLTKFLLKYGTPDVVEILNQKGDAAIGFLDYDWKLNGQK